jgi:hypothetical protein
LVKRISARARKALVKKVEQACRSKHLAPKALAQDANCNVRTIRNFLNGKSLREDTLQRIARAAGVDFEVALAVERGVQITKSTSAEYGMYSKDLVQSYIGYFFAYRRSFSIPENIIRSLFKFEWDDKRPCLSFKEFQTYHSPFLARRVSYDQKGDVYISNTIGLVHLLTVQLGAVRLITLTQLHHDENFMRGVVLTQAEWPDHFQPSISPIYFRKVLHEQDLDRLVEKVGPIEPGDSDYTDVSRILVQTEVSVAKFAKSPAGLPTARSA